MGIDDLGRALVVSLETFENFLALGVGAFGADCIRLSLREVATDGSGRASTWIFDKSDERLLGVA